MPLEERDHFRQLRAEVLIGRIDQLWQAAGDVVALQHPAPKNHPKAISGSKMDARTTANESVGDNPALAA
ncbi:MAG: hypothetical protein R2748_08250 [Bryobacterales bacterium]